MSEDLEIKIDKNKLKKYGETLNKYRVVLLLLIPIFLAIFFRVYTYDLPITDDIAKSNIESSLKNNIRSQLITQYPDLSEQDLNIITQQQYQKFITENKDQLKQQEKLISDQIKSNFQNDEGHTYLLDIDSYVYFLEARNYLGDNEKAFTINEHYDSIYSREPKIFHPFFIAFLYKILHPIFNLNLLDVDFLVPMIIATLSVIPAFFITRRVAGNIGGVFGASILALNTSLLSRSAAGVADTDPYNVLFPLLIVWLLIESFIAKNKKYEIILAASAGILTGIYGFVWSAWWFNFIMLLGGLGIYFFFLIIKHRKGIKQIFKNPDFKLLIQNSILYFVFTFISVSLISGINKFIDAFKNPFAFSALQQATKPDAWPNVYTTVAELNPSSFAATKNAVGGNLYFYIAVLGIILLLILLRKKTLGVLLSSIIAVWFVGTIYAATKGIRFNLNFAPAFSLAFGSALGIFFYNFSESISKAININKKLIKITFLILFVVLMIAPIKSAHSVGLNSVPLYDDTWDGTFSVIKEKTPKETIIASWWDYGWWFMSMAERQVIFSGGSQNRPEAYWIGKALSTPNEDEALSILRMLSCGKNTAYNLINKKYDSPLKSTNLVTRLISLEKEESKSILISEGFENYEEILDDTHCSNPPPLIFITSEDMIGKAGVWSHFGHWDFEKAIIYNKIKSSSKEDSISFMKRELNYSEEQAESTYNLIKSFSDNQEINNWISPFSGFSLTKSCVEQENTTVCSNGLVIENNTGFISTNQGLIKPQYFNYNGELISYQDGAEGVSLGYNNNTKLSFMTDSTLVDSMFTKLFFFDGKNVEHFELIDSRTGFNSFKISTWKVNLPEI